MLNSFKIAFFALINLSFMAKATIAEEITYKGTGTYTATQVLMPLSNGNAVVHVTNNTVATLEPSESGFMIGQCAGLGFLEANGNYQANIYCTFSENETNSLDLKGITKADITEVEIIGGTGKWDKAKGTGIFRRKFINANRGSYDYELKIITP